MGRRLSDAEVDQLVARYTTLLPDGTWEGTSALARAFGTSSTTVAARLRQRGVIIRTAKESHSGGKRCKPVKNLPQGRPSACACECGQLVAWNQRKNRWNRYASGHYRQAAPYKDEAWLRAAYVDRQRTAAEIAAECGVTPSTIKKFLRAYRIPMRNRSESRMGRKVGALNPAWKGGVADWPYSPDWKVLARKIRQRDNYTCQDCGEQRQRWGVHLHVHHIDGNKLNNDPGNLISLCTQCHKDRHRTNPPAPGPRVRAA